jgi:riboflavin synthase
MFTGIVSELGTVEHLDAADASTRFTIKAPATVSDLAVGDSVSVNGVCLTAVSVEPQGFTATAVSETLERTALGALDNGARVNLERPMLATGRFDGHIVQGHVDGVGTVVHVRTEGDARRFTVSMPPELFAYVVEKGSITVDGISLTVTAVGSSADEARTFEFVAIPHTLDSTVLGDRAVGDLVNIEVDVIAKYVERLMETGQ